MSIINSVLKLFIGDKSKQDVKSILPIVDKIKTLEPNMHHYLMISLDQKPIFLKKELKKLVMRMKSLF